MDRLFSIHCGQFLPSFFLTGSAKRGFSVNPIVDSVFPWGCMLIGNKFWSLHVHSCFLFQTKYTINYVCMYTEERDFFSFNLNNSFKFFAFQMFHIYNYSVNLLKLSIFAHILKKSQLFLFPPLETSFELLGMKEWQRDLA